MLLVQIFNIDINSVKINNNKNLKFLNKKFIDLTLKACGTIKKTKK